MLTSASPHSLRVEDLADGGRSPAHPSHRTATAAGALSAAGGDRPHAVVIGAGFGGLAAAMRLGARGYRVTVLERLDAVGGRAYVFRQDGFTFDAGPTIITAPFLLEELWALCGRRFSDDVTLAALDPFYAIRFDDGAVFTCSADAAEMRAEVARLAPGDVAGYERYMAVSQDMYESGFDKLADKPFSRLTDMLSVLPDLARLRADRSMLGLVSKYVRDPRLRIALSFQPLFVGGNPLTVTSFYSMIAHLERAFGVHFVMGGTGRLAEAMADVVRDQGGVVQCGAHVTEIVTREGRATGVQLADGARIDADVVVSNADAAHTYKHLLKRTRRRRWSDARLNRARYSMSLFVWYFGTNRRYEHVPHHMIVLGPRYQPLLRDIFSRKHLADDFSLYLHRPTATDPSLAPEGCDSFYALSPVPHLDSGDDWPAMAESYRQKVAERLSNTVLPGLESAVVSSHVLTPQGFQDRLLSEKGAAFGLEPALTQMAWFRPHNASEDVAGLYLVGAGTHPGAGVPGVLCSAKVADKLIPSAADALAQRPRAMEG